MGSTKAANAFIAPVVVAASADSPSLPTITASVKPTTDCELREMMIGQDRPKSWLSPGRVNDADAACWLVCGALVSTDIAQNSSPKESQKGAAILHADRRRGEC